MGVVGLLGAVRVARCWINVLQAWTKIAPNREWRDAQPLRESCLFFSFQYHNIKSVLEGNIYSAGYIQGHDLRSCARLKTIHDCMLGMLTVCSARWVTFFFVCFFLLWRTLRM